MNLKRRSASQVKRDSCLSSADGTLKYCFPWQRRGSKQLRCNRGDPCPRLGQELCPSPFLPVLQSPKCPPHPNIWMDINPHQQVMYALGRFHSSTTIPLLPFFTPAPSANPRQAESPGDLGKEPREEHGSILCTASAGRWQGPLRFVCSHIEPFRYVLRHRERQFSANLQARCQLPSL